MTARAQQIYEDEVRPALTIEGDVGWMQRLFHNDRRMKLALKNVLDVLSSLDLDDEPRARIEVAQMILETQLNEDGSVSLRE